MTAGATRVSDSDVALLRAVARDRSVVAASRRLGISRDQAVYRIARLARAFGGPVVAAVRGGCRHGASRLTLLGDRIARAGFRAVELLDGRAVAPPSQPNLLKGTFRAVPSPAVRLRDGTLLRVAFSADDGEAVAVAVDPEAILVARARFPSSARNVLRARVVGRPGAGSRAGSSLTLRSGTTPLRASITREAVRQLGLRPGRPVWLYVKATAVRRVAIPGSRPS